MPHIPDRHADHDLTLVAALATRDADPAEQAAADELVASCTDCAELLADLRSLATATAELPAPRRRRDYRLTAEQAARLRPTGLRRVFAAFGSARFAFAAPLGTAMATLGLVGLLVAAIPGPLAMGTPVGEDTSGPAAGAAPVDTLSKASAAPAAGAPIELQGEPSAAAGRQETTQLPLEVGEGDAAASAAAAVPDDGALQRLAPATGVPLAIVSLVALVVGLLLVAARWLARREVRPA